nr:cysteinyl-tRNA synthetase [uncultured bacterium]
MSSSALHVYNTLSRKKELFEPLHAPHVGMYVCGPTVYGNAHLGHAKSYISFDIVRRYLRYLGYKVRYVQNITDVGHLVGDGDEGEDKISKIARIEQLDPMEIAETYTYTYFRDMDALSVQRPDISPRATGHIPEQIAMIQNLIDKGHAYACNGNVYFDVLSAPKYGQLSGRNIEDATSGTRVETASDKRNPADFALWKKADDQHLMKWLSPWGVGYPGWHIECSAMSIKYLGAHFDIHGGGLENQFPHHECEIAQSECSTGESFAKYWLHNNMVTLDGQKMGKSLGNAISLEEFFKGSHPLLKRSWNPQVIRFFLLQSHYRSTTDFSEKALEAAETGFQSLRTTLQSILAYTQQQHNDQTEGETNEALPALQAAFESAMNDDFNTAQAIAALFDHTKKIKRNIADGLPPSDLHTLQNWLNIALTEILGLEYSEPNETDSSFNDNISEYLLHLLIDLRTKARMERNFELSDIIRNRLKELDIELEDSKEGTRYTLPK